MHSRFHVADEDEVRNRSDQGPHTPDVSREAHAETKPLDQVSRFLVQLFHVQVNLAVLVIIVVTVVVVYRLFGFRDPWRRCVVFALSRCLVVWHRAGLTGRRIVDFAAVDRNLPGNPGNGVLLFVLLFVPLLVLLLVLLFVFFQCLSLVSLERAAADSEIKVSLRKTHVALRGAIYTTAGPGPRSARFGIARLQKILDPRNTIIIIIYPLTARVVGVPQMISKPIFSIFPALHCPLGSAELQACPFPTGVFPPRPLSALSSSPFHCARLQKRLDPRNTIIIIIYPLIARVVGVPQMILKPIFSIFPCSPLPSGTCRTTGLSIPCCCLPTSFCVCLVFFPLLLCLARWFWPELMNGRHDHTTAICLRLFTVVRRSSCGPIACRILARTSSLVTWSLYDMCSILR